MIPPNIIRTINTTERSELSITYYNERDMFAVSNWAQNLLGDMPTPSRTDDYIALQGNGLTVRILAWSGTPEAWRTSYEMSQSMIAMMITDQWPWTWFGDLMWEPIRPVIHIHRYGIEIQVRFALK